MSIFYKIIVWPFIGVFFLIGILGYLRFTLVNNEVNRVTQIQADVKEAFESFAYDALDDNIDEDLRIHRVVTLKKSDSEINTYNQYSTSVGINEVDRDFRDLVTYYLKQMPELEIDQKNIKVYVYNPDFTYSTLGGYKQSKLPSMTVSVEGYYKPIIMSNSYEKVQVKSKVDTGTVNSTNKMIGFSFDFTVELEQLKVDSGTDKRDKTTVNGNAVSNGTYNSKDSVSGNAPVIDENYSKFKGLTE